MRTQPLNKYLMKQGRRISNPVAKQLAGTFRDDRHGNIVELATPVKSVPVPPAYLSKEAKMVWDEELPRVVACGAVVEDSSTFARYCTAEAAFREMAVKKEPLSAALMTELRRSAELFGIAGQRSRLTKLASSEPAAKPMFSVRPT